MRFLLLLPLLAALAGCERPFIEPASPTIEVVSPVDLSVVRSQPTLPLAFRATTVFGAIDRVEVNGVPATFFRDEDFYLDTLQLSTGLNRIVVEAFTEAGTVGGDTLFAVFLPARFGSVAAQLPAPLGGHAAVTLLDGTTLLTGGAASVTEPAQDGALVFDPTDFSFAALPEGMAQARVGHAASRLPDGRVLITGGSRRLDPADLDAFVTDVELFDPATSTFSTVAVVAADSGTVAPIRRTEHTVTVLQGDDGQVSVYLYGGIGNLGTLSEPSIGALPFMRRLRFEDGPAGPRLVVPDRSEGFRFTAIARHTQTPVSDVGADGFGRYLVAGASDPSDPDVAAPFELVFARSFLDALAVGPLVEPRTEAASAPLADGLVLVTGGAGPESGTVRPSGEVFASEAGVFFQFAEDVRLAIPRWGHTATNIGGDRILLVGGFSAAGQALARTELFDGTP
jgi:hypothetical protein